MTYCHLFRKHKQGSSVLLFVKKCCLGLPWDCFCYSLLFVMCYLLFVARVSMSEKNLSAFTIISDLSLHARRTSVGKRSVVIVFRHVSENLLMHMCSRSPIIRDIFDLRAWSNQEIPPSAWKFIRRFKTKDGNGRALKAKRQHTENLSITAGNRWTRPTFW